MGSSRRRAASLAVVLAIAAATLGFARSAGAANPWVRVAAPSPGSDRTVLFGVECEPGGGCIAAGYYSNAANVRPFVTYTPSERTQWFRQFLVYPSPLTQLNDLSCVGQFDCTAVGYYLAVRGPDRGQLLPVVLTLDGTGTLATLPDLRSPRARLLSVDCVTATRCRAVGNVGRRTLILRTSNGVDWFREPSPSLGAGDNVLQSIDCVSNADCTAVGYFDPLPGDDSRSRTLVLRLAGGPPWTVVPSPNPAPAVSKAFLDEVSCVAATRCVTVGGVEPASAAGNRGFVLQTSDGSSWTRSPTPATAGQVELVGVDCRTATACTVTGVAWNAARDRILRNIILRTTNGTTWSSPSPGSERAGRALFGVSCDTEVTCVSVGTFNDSGNVGDPTRALVMKET
jgi:hypothetical protein